MRGYGELSEESALQLDEKIWEMRRLVQRLRVALENQ
jgi:hypothetical protein